MAKANSPTHDFTEKVQTQVKKNTLSSKKIELSIQLDQELEALRLLGSDSKRLPQIEEKQSTISAIKDQINLLEQKNKKLNLDKDSLNIALSVALLEPSQIFYELSNNYPDVERDFANEVITVLDAIGTNKSFLDSKIRMEQYMTMDVIKRFLSRDVNKGKTVGFYVQQINDIAKSLTTLEESKQKLDKQEIKKSAYESRKLKAQAHASILSGTIDDSGKKLIDFDGDNELSINKSLTTKTKNDYKLAKMQNKEGDDSSIELHGEKFTGFGNEEIAFAYQTVQNLGLGSGEIVGNIATSIKANAEQFKHYLAFRFKDKKVGDADIKLINQTIESGNLSVDKPLEKQLMQIYLSDFSNRITTTPFNIMMGLANKTIPTSKTEKLKPLTDVSITQTHDVVDKAIKLMTPEQQSTINKLSSEQRAWLDLHITGLFLYRQKSVVSTSSGTKLYEETGNTLSVGVAQTLLDDTFGSNGNQSVHIDLTVIPSIPLTAKSIGVPNFFIGPNGSYRIDIGDTQLFATGFVGSSIQGNKGGGGLVGVTQNMSGKKLGSKTHYVTLGAGGGATSFDGVYVSAFVGMGVDRIKSIVNNTKTLGTLFDPIIKGLTADILSDDKQFASYLKTNKIDVKRNAKVVGELQELLKFLAEYAGGIDNLRNNTQGTFAEVLTQAYEHNAKLDLEGLKVDGIVIDPVKFLTSTTLWGKVFVLAGLLKINRYKTLISHSGEYRSSRSEVINITDQSAEKRAETIATRLTQYISSTVGLGDYRIEHDGKGSIVIPKNALVYVNNNNQENVTIGSDEQIDVTIVKDRVLITTKKLEAKEPVGDAIITITKQPEINISIDAKDIVMQANVAAVDCRNIEKNFDAMKASITALLVGVKDRNTIDWTNLKHIYNPGRGTNYLPDLGISNASKPYTVEEIKSLLSSESSYHSGYDAGRLNAWLLAHYDSNKKDNNVYKIYQKLLRYETVLRGSFLELNGDRSLLRVTHREKNLDTRLAKEQAKTQIIAYREKLAEAMKKAPYQGYAKVDDGAVSGFTWGYSSDHYDKTVLENNIFITTSGDVEKGKSFADTFVNVKIDPKDDSMIAYIKDGLNPKFPSAYIDGYKKTLNDQKITMGDKTGTLSELGYHLDLDQLNPAYFYHSSEIELPVLDKDNKKVGTTIIDRSKSGFYSVGNWQCGANETFIFVPDWSAKIQLTDQTPPLAKRQLAPASVNLMQETMQVDNVTRGMVVGGGYGIAKGTFDTTPETGDKRTTDPETGKPIKTGPETGGETEPPVKNNPDSPKINPPGGSKDNPDSPKINPPGGSKDNPDSPKINPVEKGIGTTSDVIPAIVINENQ